MKGEMYYIVQHPLPHIALDEVFDPLNLTTPRDVQQVIGCFRGRIAADSDNIPYLGLTNAHRKLVVLLTRLFNAMFLHSYLPAVWKNVKIVKIPKIEEDNLFSSEL